jgi:hypothetical protein
MDEKERVARANKGGFRRQVVQKFPKAKTAEDAAQEQLDSEKLSRSVGVLQGLRDEDGQMGPVRKVAPSRKAPRRSLSAVMHSQSAEGSRQYDQPPEAGSHGTAPSQHELEKPAVAAPGQASDDEQK